MKTSKLFITGVITTIVFAIAWITAELMVSSSSVPKSTIIAALFITNLIGVVNIILQAYLAVKLKNWQRVVSIFLLIGSVIAIVFTIFANILIYAWN